MTARPLLASLLGIVAAASLLATPTVAAPNQPSQQGSQGSGKPADDCQIFEGIVTAVGNSSITINGDSGSAQTFAITSETRIHDNRQPASISNVKVGQQARVASRDGKTAVRIHAHDVKGQGAQGGRQGANQGPNQAGPNQGQNQGPRRRPQQGTNAGGANQ